MKAHQTKLKWVWIINPKKDLLFFIGSVFFSILFYGMYFLYRTSDLRIYLTTFTPLASGEFLFPMFFYSFFDHPHILQTFSRTHADPNEFQRRKFVYTYGFFFLIITGFVIKALDLLDAFTFLLEVYGAWHILRQNCGLARCYAIKGKQNTRKEILLDQWLLYSAFLFLFFPYFQKRYMLEHSSISFFLQTLFALIFGLMVLSYFINLIYHWTHKIPLLAPKLLLLVAVLSVQWFAYRFIQAPLPLIVAVETLYHDIQYQGWICHYQKVFFPLDHNFNKRWLIYSLLYGFSYAVLILLSIPYPIFTWAICPFTMVIFFHYFIDGKIWRFSTDPSLKRLLS